MHQTGTSRTGHTTQAPGQALRMALFYYGRPGLEARNRIINVRPEYLICNASQGLWGSINGRAAGWSRGQIEDFRRTGIRGIGYITSGYEGTGTGGSVPRDWYTLEMNLKLIARMAELDRVDGVFVDECTSFPHGGSREYLQTLSGAARGRGLTVWANVGENDFDPWFFDEGGFDFVHSTEHWRGQGPSWIQRRYGDRISVTALEPGHQLKDAVRLTLDAWSKGLAYCYVTNSYLELPAWLEEYGRALAHARKEE